MGRDFLSEASARCSLSSSVSVEKSSTSAFIGPCFSLWERLSISLISKILMNLGVDFLNLFYLLIFKITHPVWNSVLGIF